MQPEIQQPPRSNAMLYGGIAAVVILVLLILLYLWNSSSSTPNSSASSSTPSASSPSAPPPVYTTVRCGGENENCLVGQSGKVLYLGNGVSIKKFTAGQTIGCNNNVFGDPLPGIVKACYTSTGSDPYLNTKCADEGGNCVVGPQAEVLYGSKGSNLGSFTAGQTIGCNNNVFGDPLYGTVKACYTGNQQ
jgi:hypothetical protein